MSTEHRPRPWRGSAPLPGSSAAIVVWAVKQHRRRGRRPLRRVGASPAAKTTRRYRAGAGDSMGFCGAGSTPGGADGDGRQGKNGSRAHAVHFNGRVFAPRRRWVWILARITWLAAVLCERCVLAGGRLSPFGWLICGSAGVESAVWCSFWFSVQRRDVNNVEGC